MGGAAGHMWHPYQCPEVKNGRDLISFYIKTLKTIETSPPSIKLDGVNVSFRLKRVSSYPGFVFVVDRGTKTNPIDFEGISSDNAAQRFVSNNPDKPHGMIEATRILTSILNSDRENLKPYLEEIGIFERMGPYGIYFNAEFYSDKDGDGIGNVTKYNKNYIAIHGLGEFYDNNPDPEKESRTSRSIYHGLEEEINDLKDRIEELESEQQDASEIRTELNLLIQEYYAQKTKHGEVLKKIARELQNNANKYGFESISTIPVRFKDGENVETVTAKINEVLDKEWTFLHKNFYLQNTENEKFDGPMGVGPGKFNTESGKTEGRTLREHLQAIKTNPEYTIFRPYKHKGKPVNSQVHVSDYFFREVMKKERNPKNDKERRQYVFAKAFYEAVLNNVGIADIAHSNEDVGPINDAVVIWHATRMIGNVIKESLTADTDLGLSVFKHEGIVLALPNLCGGRPFKFTGEFILDNKSPHRSDVEKDESSLKVGELLHEVKLYEDPQEAQEKKFVILIPGGFKPPTGGHYSMIKQYEKKPNVLKVFVVTGPKPRDGVTLAQSKQIFDIYGGFSDKVEFITGEEPTPLTTCYELIKNPQFTNRFPEAYFSVGASNKDDDKKRINGFIEYFLKNDNLTNAKVYYYEPADALEVEGEPASASRMRKAFQQGDWDTFKKLLPDDNFYDDVVQVLSGRGQERVNENFLLARPESLLVNEVYSEKQRRWACAQMDDPDELTKKQAKEMCKSKKLKKKKINEQEDILRKKINLMMKNIVARIEELIDDSKLDALVDTITNQISVAAEKEVEEDPMGAPKDPVGDMGADEEEEMLEASGMAGGGMQGGGSAWTKFQGEENEQERAAASRI